ncbi:short-chain dehydrogenase reductase family [Colletotrichum karsti]|uniref:Short-chain dehydrogenase reductase family n=1 Tax=Colletotrichum karsti TaxID=1095194 RepID=A0A9P6IB01_9PEZI|nr:short-chain dehydrogenase reductase family [Colletotrichum karsti]KAF9877236.1 short-chain dehydrogenase reductase family [Colletotrichum karsti]
MAPQLNWDTKGSDLVTTYADHIKGKTILVTGVSPGGLGAVFAEAVAAAAPATLILAGRNTAKVQQTADSIAASHPSVAIKPLELDLGSFKGVRKAAETVNGWGDVPHIDVLVNNAGIMAVPFALTEDGFENQFGTNHLGPFLFTNLIIGKVLAAPAPRVVMDGKHYNKWFAYGQSKTANCLMALSLAEKLGERGLLSFSLHPGVIWTNLADHIEDFDSLKAHDISMGNKYMWSEFKAKTPDQGIATHVYAAFAPGLEDLNGKYFNDCRLADQYKEEVYPWATDKIDADRLWKLSEKLVGQEFKFE